MPTTRPFETSGTISAEPKPGAVQDVGVEEIRRRLRHVADDQRFARADDAAEQRLLDLEDDLRPRPRAPLLFV